MADDGISKEDLEAVRRLVDVLVKAAGRADPSVGPALSAQEGAYLTVREWYAAAESDEAARLVVQEADGPVSEILAARALIGEILSRQPYPFARRLAMDDLGEIEHDVLAIYRLGALRDELGDEGIARGVAEHLNRIGDFARNIIRVAEALASAPEARVFLAADPEMRQTTDWPGNGDIVTGVPGIDRIARMMFDARTVEVFKGHLSPLGSVFPVSGGPVEEAARRFIRRFVRELSGIESRVGQSFELTRASGGAESARIRALASAVEREAGVSLLESGVPRTAELRRLMYLARAGTPSVEIGNAMIVLANHVARGQVDRAGLRAALAEIIFGAERSEQIRGSAAAFREAIEEAARAHKIFPPSPPPAPARTAAAIAAAQRTAEVPQAGAARATGAIRRAIARNGGSSRSQNMLGQGLRMSRDALTRQGMTEPMVTKWRAVVRELEVMEITIVRTLGEYLRLDFRRAHAAIDSALADLRGVKVVQPILSSIRDDLGRVSAELGRARVADDPLPIIREQATTLAAMEDRLRQLPAATEELVLGGQISADVAREIEAAAAKVAEAQAALSRAINEAEPLVAQGLSFGEIIRASDDSIRRRVAASWAVRIARLEGEIERAGERLTPEMAALVASFQDTYAQLTTAFERYALQDYKGAREALGLAETSMEGIGRALGFRWPTGLVELPLATLFRLLPGRPPRVWIGERGLALVRQEAAQYVTWRNDLLKRIVWEESVYARGAGRRIWRRRAGYAVAAGAPLTGLAYLVAGSIASTVATVNAKEGMMMLFVATQLDVLLWGEGCFGENFRRDIYGEDAATRNMEDASFALRQSAMRMDRAMVAGDVAAAEQAFVALQAAARAQTDAYELGKYGVIVGLGGWTDFGDFWARGQVEIGALTVEEARRALDDLKAGRLPTRLTEQERILDSALDIANSNRIEASKAIDRKDTVSAARWISDGRAQIEWYRGLMEEYGPGIRRELREAIDWRAAQIEEGLKYMEEYIRTPEFQAGAAVPGGRRTHVSVDQARTLLAAIGTGTVEIDGVPRSAAEVEAMIRVGQLDEIAVGALLAQLVGARGGVGGTPSAPRPATPGIPARPGVPRPTQVVPER